MLDPMNSPNDELEMATEHAESELSLLRRQCEKERYSDESRNRLWRAIDRWVNHPLFLEDFSPVQSAVLNQLTFCLATNELREEAWLLIGKLAAEWWERDNRNLMEAIRISTFELAAEPPEDPEFIKLLFSLAKDRNTRWAVFSAYENYPWRLRPHAHQYSNGMITDRDVDKWLSICGLDDDRFLMQRDRED